MSEIPFEVCQLCCFQGCYVYSLQVSRLVVGEGSAVVLKWFEIVNRADLVLGGQDSEQGGFNLKMQPWFWLT